MKRLSVYPVHEKRMPLHAAIVRGDYDPRLELVAAGRNVSTRSDARGLTHLVAIPDCPSSSTCKFAPKFTIASSC